MHRPIAAAGQYVQHCAVCHGKALEGNGEVPAFGRAVHSRLERHHARSALRQDASDDAVERARHLSARPLPPTSWPSCSKPTISPRARRNWSRRPTRSRASLSIPPSPSRADAGCEEKTEIAGRAHSNDARFSMHRILMPTRISALGGADLGGPPPHAQQSIHELRIALCVKPSDRGFDQISGNVN